MYIGKEGITAVVSIETNLLRPAGELSPPASSDECATPSEAGEGEDTIVEAEPSSFTFEGRRYPVLSKLLFLLMKDPALLAPLEMLIPFFAALGRVTMLAAREKLGKSTLVAFLVSKLSNGQMLWGMKLLAPTKVLYVSLEEGLGDLVRRFAKMGANADNIRVIDSLPVKGALNHIAAEVHHFGAKLIVIDSLAALATAIEDENSATGWTAFLRELTAIARTQNVAIIVIHHGNKQSGKYRGSSAIGAAMDMIIEMDATDEASTRRQFATRGRWDTQPFELGYDATSGEWALLAGGPSVRESEAQLELDTQVLELVTRQHGVTKTSLREAIGGDKAKVDAALARLLQAGDVARLGLRSGYCVPALATALPDNSSDSPYSPDGCDTLEDDSGLDGRTPLTMDELEMEFGSFD